MGEGTDLEAVDRLAHRLVDGGVGDRGDRHLLLEDVLGLLVQLAALVLVGDPLGFLDQLVVAGVAPFGDVVAVDRVAAIEGRQPVVRVAVVAGPAEQHGVVLAGVGALDVLAPFVADDPGLDADLRPVGLDHLGHQLGVGVVGTLYRHGPEGDLGAFGDAGFLQQFAGLGWIERGVLDGLVVGPLGRRHAVHGQLPGAW
ncbi:hypothetical protein G039_0321280 [Pseudomonas aeruginosa VRFPA01]|nr:hypothetical protein G039_0321280 [Pseudomonas aeruginosa VRFPA01]